MQYDLPRPFFKRSVTDHQLFGHQGSAQDHQRDLTSFYNIIISIVSRFKKIKILSVSN